MRPTLRQLEILVAVADEGTLSAAAEALGIDQSSVSRAISGLERAVGTSLVIRAARATRLSASGREVVGRARQALRLVDDIPGHVRSSPITGRVTIGAFRSGAAFLLPPIVASLGQAHPGIEVAVRSLREVDGGVGAAVASGRCEIGLTSLPTTQRQLQTTVLTEDPYVRVEPSTVPSDDRSLPFIHWHEDCSHRALAWLDARGLLPKQIIDVEDDEVVLAFVAKGVGWSLMPALAARPARRQIRLRPIDDGPSRTIGVCVHPDAAQRPAVAAVHRALREGAN